MRTLIYFVTACLFFFTQQCFSAVLDVLIKDPVPQTVPAFGKVSAFYIIKNTKNFNLTGVFTKKLPLNVTQVTCDPNYCGATFDLGAQGSPNDSCILKLTVKGPVHARGSSLLICTATECDEANTPLDVSLSDSLPFIAINSGSYSNYHAGIFPLLATTADSGDTWSYPVGIFQDLKSNIDPNFSNGVLSSASCNNTFDKSVCISAGQWCKGSFCDNPLPLIAVGIHYGSIWRYPKSVFENLQTVVDPDFTGGALRSSSCFGSGGNTVCIAGGTYSTASSSLPLIARSVNAGNDWTYPKTIFQNLTSAIDPNFKNGSLFSASCTQSTCDSVCISAGNFCTTEHCDSQLPLLAMSTDKGSTWHYPAEVFKNLDSKLDPSFSGGFFVNSSCTGVGNQAICTAVGSFTNNQTTLPLLALTKDGGSTWNYPPEIFKNLTTTLGHGFTAAIFNATSCSGAKSKAICIAAGSCFRKGNGSPLIGLSQDGGNSWTYPDFIYTKLKTVVDAQFQGGNFDGASCIGSGKKGICLAAGGYCRKDQLCFPLIALSTNGGKTWSYPASVYSNLLNLVDSHFRYGFFSDISCKGTAEHNFCVASGQYSNDSSETFPLIAFSKDSGHTWTYPSYIYQNLTSVIDPDFAIGSFVRGAIAGNKFKLSLKEKQFMLQLKK